MTRRRRGWTEKTTREIERQRFRLRIERIKEIPFIDAFDKVALGVSWEPNQVPYHIACPLPDHFERTPSCYLQKHRWWCFGCDRGGDVIDFAQGYHDIPRLERAIRLVEKCLGLQTPKATDSDLALKATLARASKSDMSKAQWEDMVWEVSDSFSSRLKPYTRCVDPLVSTHAEGVSDYVYEAVRREMEYMPISPRGRREGVRRLYEWAHGWASGVERDIERMTGKDALDCALQGSGYPRILVAVPQDPQE